MTPFSREPPEPSGHRGLQLAREDPPHLQAADYFGDRAFRRFSRHRRMLLPRHCRPALGAAAARVPCARPAGYCAGPVAGRGWAWPVKRGSGAISALASRQVPFLFPFFSFFFFPPFPFFSFPLSPSPLLISFFLLTFPPRCHACRCAHRDNTLAKASRYLPEVYDRVMCATSSPMPIPAARQRIIQARAPARAHVVIHARRHLIRAHVDKRRQVREPEYVQI